MPVLTSRQRKLLEDACIKGRRVSEQAVRAGLTSLDVTAERPPAHLNEADRQLRRGLRAKARQLGDEGDDFGLLVAECAYEQWHRLLFARFLAENNLLIHPEYRAPVTLDDCEELAESIGEPDGWSVAARFAAEILPGIFRLDDPCVQLRLTAEGRLSLESILAGLPSEIFQSDDALGWVYQFWQKDKKDEVNSSERKIGGADLGPVTQLFTENYMVRFLLQNSLGAWWAARHPDSPMVNTFEYLRFDDTGFAASGPFDGWPDRVAKVTLMDPCCGSGHFLIEAFSMLSLMRAEEEGLGIVEAQDAVLRDNLFGLELDPRCVQIGMFAVACQAWKIGGGWRQLPVPNIACSGIPVNASVEEWKQLAGGDERLLGALVRLHILFRDADTLGSLIDPKRVTELADPTRLQRSLEDVEWDDIAPILQQAVRAEALDPATAVLGADAAGIARAADFLSRHYTLVITNPPFLARWRQGPMLQDLGDHRFSSGRADLATMFVMRCSQFAGAGGVVATVSPQNWLFQVSYEDLRRDFLRSHTWHVVAQLGEHGFESPAAAGAFVALFVLEVAPPSAASELRGIDAVSAPDPTAKAAALRASPLLNSRQSTQLANGQACVILRSLGDGAPLSRYCRATEGLSTGDGERFLRQMWEVPANGNWRPLQEAPAGDREYSGLAMAIYWDGDDGELARSSAARIQGREAWGRPGVLVGRVRTMRAGLHLGHMFEKSSVVLLPTKNELLPALYEFCRDEEFHDAVRSIDSSLKVTISTLLKVPFDVDRWRARAEENFPDGLPEPWSDDPTQWLFEGSPQASTEPLQVAVSRLVGFRWPASLEMDDLDMFADGDGIVCLPSVAGEPPAHDRLQQLLATSFGQSWSPAIERELLGATGSKKKDLGDWLRDDFFKQHCALFEHRPFIWHIWDGQRDGFAALVNYHHLDRQTLEKLTYTYLGDWIERQRAEVRDEKAGAEARLAAASKLRGSLELILDGEPPYDIYVRWKSLAGQPIGWDPDINDGVRVNVRPFVEAGVLRSSFNVHWRKDRGTNLDGSERKNDLHFTSSEKSAARGESA